MVIEQRLKATPTICLPYYLVSLRVKRSAANYFLWLYLVNNLTQYFFSYPIKIVKAYVGVSMDGFVSGRSINGILKDIHGWRKIPAMLFMGCGWLLAKK